MTIQIFNKKRISMKSQIVLIVTIITSILWSCKKSSSDIKLSELNEVCDYINAIEIVTNEMISYGNSHYNDIYAAESFIAMQDTVYNSQEERNKRIKIIGEFDPKYADQFYEMRIKLIDIEKVLLKKYERKEFKECDNFKNVVSKYDSLNKLVSKIPLRKVINDN